MQLTNFFKDSCTGWGKPAAHGGIKALSDLIQRENSQGSLIGYHWIWHTSSHIYVSICSFLFPWSLEDLHQQEIEVHTEAEPHRIVVNGLLGLITCNRRPPDPCSWWHSPSPHIRSRCRGSHIAERLKMGRAARHIPIQRTNDIRFGFASTFL